MENLPWLFGAFALGWALIFAYLFWISRKEQALRRKVGALEALLKDDSGSS
jgi:CcmD family protein